MSTIEGNEITSLANWKKAAGHEITLPSGVRVEIRVPDLPALIEAGQLPSNLVDAAIEAAGGNEGRQKPKGDARDLIAQEREFTDLLVQLTVTKPKLSADSISDIPFEDKALIVEIATRQTDFDAEGNHIGGLDRSAKFRKFRNLDGFDPSLADF